MWQNKTALQYKALRELGVTAAKIQIDRETETKATAKRKAAIVLSAGLVPYIENIGTDFFSAYHRWTPGKPVNQAFIDAKRSLIENPQSRTAFVRIPSLSDPDKQLDVQRRLRRAVADFGFARPLYFDLGDETGIADLSASWDFDFSPMSLKGMRVWLKEQYGTLVALNGEWGSHFARWQDVVPPTTSEAMASAGNNYSGWSDFKAWMDIDFSNALKAGTSAIHASAPWALSGIEGAQMPGWGGYDYSNLANAVDVMEIYDADANVDIATSFNPHLVILTSSDFAAPASIHDAWYEFLRGARGVILWDENNHFVRQDGSWGPNAGAARLFFAAMNGAAAKRIASSEVHRDPVAVVYSPASFRIQWMVDHKALGRNWMKRTAQDENEDNAVRVTRRYVQQLMIQMGFAPRFIVDRDVATGLLSMNHYRAVIMPQVLALSAKSANQITSFVRKGGLLISYGKTGEFDEHGRAVKRPLLSQLLEGDKSVGLLLSGDSRNDMVTLKKAFAKANLIPVVKVTDIFGHADPDVKQFVFDKGCTYTVALLADSGTRGTENVRDVRLILNQTATAYDLNKAIFLGRQRDFTVRVAGHSPTVIELNPAGCRFSGVPH